MAVTHPLIPRYGNKQKQRLSSQFSINDINDLNDKKPFNMTNISHFSNIPINSIEDHFHVQEVKKTLIKLKQRTLKLLIIKLLKKQS